MEIIIRKGPAPTKADEEEGQKAINAAAQRIIAHSTLPLEFREHSKACELIYRPDFSTKRTQYFFIMIYAYEGYAHDIKTRAKYQIGYRDVNFRHLFSNSRAQADRI